MKEPQEASAKEHGGLFFFSCVILLQFNVLDRSWQNLEHTHLLHFSGQPENKKGAKPKAKSKTKPGTLIL